MTFINTKPKLVIPVIASILILGVLMPSMLLDDAFAKANKVTICHVPLGNPDNSQTIEVSENAVAAHLAHGDSLGECGETQIVTYLELRSHSGHFLDNTADNDCADGNILVVTAVGFPFDPVFIKIKSSNINDCNVGLRQWDVSSIPDNAEIISVEWIATFHQNPGNQYPPICDIVQLDTQPSTATDVQALMDEVNSNPSFVEDDSFCSSGGAKTVNLGPSAVAHLENVSLLNDWFAFAIKARPDTTQQSFHQSAYTDEFFTQTTLRVVYTTTS